MRTLRLSLAATVVAVATLAPAASSAQPARAYAGGSIAETFDGLASTGGPFTFAGALDGWRATVAGSAANYSTGNGSSNAGALYAFGATGSADRALGSIASGSTGTIFFGLLLQNTSTTTFTSFDLSFVGEQWRNGGNATAHSLAFAWAIGAGAFTDAAFTAADALSFTGPVATATAAALDGNAAANRAARSGTVSGFAWAPGQTLWLRWEDVNDAGNDHGLAIDDLRFTAGTPTSVVPEPASVALVGAGLFGVLGAAARRRRAQG